MTETPLARPAVDLCPACGEAGVEACIDADGKEMRVDHEERPRELAKLLALFPPDKTRITVVD